MRNLFLPLAAVAVLAIAACPKAPEKKAPAVGDDKPLPTAATPNKGPTDADHKKADMLAYAVQVDAELAALTPLERQTEEPKRKVTLWREGKAAKKLKVDDIDKDGKVAHTTEFYFKNARLAYVRHEQGLFLFENEGLILWLDRTTQQVKRGVKPGDALKIADDLLKAAYKEVKDFT